jgi:hypothetical protein
MIVNFRARGISRGTHKLARTPTLIKKKVIFKLPLHGRILLTITS